jgi:hypothetical protein
MLFHVHTQFYCALILASSAAVNSFSAKVAQTFKWPDIPCSQSFLVSYERPAALHDPQSFAHRGAVFDLYQPMADVNPQ